MDTPSQKLLARMQELRDLGGAIGLCTWDQETYMPEGASEGRAAILGTLESLSHERLVAPEVGDWLEASLQDARLTPDQRRMSELLKEDRDRAVKLPSSLVREIAVEQSAAISAWRQARAEKDFQLFAPKLQRLLELRRAQADAWGHGGERYDALLERFERGMRVQRLTPVLEALKAQLVPLVRALAGREPLQGRPELLGGSRTYADGAQWQLTLDVLAAMGFDFRAGRQDRSIHPFTGGSHPQDVRLTTRLEASTPVPSFFGALHEGGHGLFEQGFAEGDFRTPLAASPSMGLHESQSLLWENQVGRGQAFWRHWFPRFQAAFPEALAGVSEASFHAEVNRVQPSFIRVEADEVTYNLHVVLRYELELLLLRDALPLSELPGAWDARMQQYLGITPPDPVKGVLQDIHWAWGEFGYFPTYTLGNLYAASLYAAAQRALPTLEQDIASGNLLGLRDYLRKNIHAPGYRLPAEERVRAVTGEGLTDRDFVAYLRGKYGALYGVSL
ncbi:MAG: carboxypeptidase M32 [Deltaproteobacteria bacterium]|nr:carboxypeptidase M32 [Deltaproteobacteria bacterium]